MTRDSQKRYACIGLVPWAVHSYHQFSSPAALTLAHCTLRIFRP